jgi:hypothetical protein
MATNLNLSLPSFDLDLKRFQVFLGNFVENADGSHLHIAAIHIEQ